MGMFNFWKKQSKSTITDEQRQSSIETRRLNSELKQLRTEYEKQKLREQYELESLRMQEDKLKLQQKISELKQDLEPEEYEEEDEEEELSLEKVLQMVLMQKLIPQGSETVTAQNVITPNSPQTVSEPLILSDDEIKDYLRTLSKQQLKQAKLMPNSVLSKLIKTQLPSIEDDTLNRAITLLKQF